MMNLTTKQQMAIVASNDFDKKLYLAKTTTTVSVLKSLLTDSSQKVRLRAVKNLSSSKVVLHRAIELYSESTDPIAIEILIAVARHSMATGCVLDALATNTNQFVLRALASNTAAKKELLAQLANTSRDNQVLKAIAGNPKTSKETLDFLAEKSKTNSRVIVEIADNPNTSPATLHQILLREMGIKKVNPTVLKVAQAIVRNDLAQVQTIKLANDVIYRSQNPALAPAVVPVPEKFVAATEQLSLELDASPAVNLELGASESVGNTKEDVEKDKESTTGVTAGFSSIPMNDLDRANYARTCADVVHLQTLMGDTVLEVRMAVAGNPAVPEYMVNRLAFDRNSYVRQEVAKATHSEAVLFLLARDNNDYVRVEAAKHTKEEFTLDFLSRDASTYVAHAVASNQSTPARVLDYLALSKNNFVIKAILKNPNMTSKHINIIMGNRG